MVAVHELQAQGLGQMTADGGLAGAHETDQEDVEGFRHEHMTPLNGWRVKFEIIGTI